MNSELSELRVILKRYGYRPPTGESRAGFDAPENSRGASMNWKSYWQERREVSPSEAAYPIHGTFDVAKVSTGWSKTALMLASSSKASGQFDREMGV